MKKNNLGPVARFLDEPLKRWSKNASDTQFLRYVNWRAQLRPHRGRFTKDENGFAYLEGNRHLTFASRSRGAGSYIEGLRARASALVADYMIDKIDFNKGDLVVDCGANVGDLKLWFDFNNLKIQYIGIEPGDAEFSCLKQNITDSKLLNIALWNEDGELDFYVNFEKADSSLIQIGEFESVRRVKACRLDTLEQTKGPIRLLKVEAEGAEPEVLEGAEGCLDRID